MNSCFAQNFDAISKTIADKYSTYKKGGEAHYRIRKLLFDSGRLDFTQTADTLYFIQSFLAESGTAYGRISSAKNNVSYAYSVTREKFLDQEEYTPFMNECVQKWDTAALRLNEKLYQVMPVTSIEAIRVIKVKKEIKVERFIFHNFRNPERD